MIRFEYRKYKFYDNILKTNDIPMALMAERGVIT